MTRISTARSKCFCGPLIGRHARLNHNASGTSSLGLCARADVLETAVFPNCNRCVTTCAFRFAGAGKNPCPIHGAACSEGMTLCMLSRSSQAPLWDYPSPWRHGTALLWLRHLGRSWFLPEGRPPIKRGLALGAGPCARLRPVCPE